MLDVRGLGQDRQIFGGLWLRPPQALKFASFKSTAKTDCTNQRVFITAQHTALAETRGNTQNPTPPPTSKRPKAIRSTRFPESPATPSANRARFKQYEEIADRPRIRHGRRAAPGQHSGRRAEVKHNDTVLSVQKHPHPTLPKTATTDRCKLPRGLSCWGFRCKLPRGSEARLLRAGRGGAGLVRLARLTALTTKTEVKQRSGALRCTLGSLT